MAGDPVDEGKLRTLRVALAEGMSAAKAAKAAGIGRTTLYRLAKTDVEIAALLEAAKPRGKAKAIRGNTGARMVMATTKPRAIVPELVDDADDAEGPTVGQLMSHMWDTLQSPPEHEGVPLDGAYRAKCLDWLCKFKLGPILAEVQRQANAEPVTQGVERARLVLPDKAPPPE